MLSWMTHCFFCMVGNDALRGSTWTYLSFWWTFWLLHLGKLHLRILRVVLDVWLDLWNGIKQDAHGQGLLHSPASTWIAFFTSDLVLPNLPILK